MPNRQNTCRARPPRFRAVRQGAHWLGLAATGLLLAVGPAGANPQGGQVTAGTATIGNSSPLQLDITQSTNRAVIDWQSFNIAVGERTQFHQPSSGSWTLNRVNSPDPSTIAGYLGANGGLVLVNPAGVVFSKGSQVNVNSLIATPAGISNANFMAGNMRFDRPGNPNARIVNDGTITVAQKGLAALVAPSVANSGVIRAKLGKVVLAGAESFTLDFYGDGLINFDIGPQVASAPVVGGKQVASLVSNTGLIDAPGGTVLLTADAVAGVLENVIDSSGRIDARTMAGGPGKVTIDAGAGNQARLDGTIDVSGSQAGQQGGAAIVTGGAVHLTNNARVYAQGPAGGGTVKIGGGPHGTDASVRNAQTTTIDPGAVIDASATVAGNGGTVAVWSDGATTFNGAIYAKGGPNGGNGGWVETSGKGTLTVGDTALVDASAPRGVGGSWLLDPDSNVDITNATSNVTCTGTPLVCNPTADSSTLNATTIVNSLNGGTSVTVNTSNGGGSQPGNITLDSAIALANKVSTQSETLTLNAGAGGGSGAITFNQSVADGTNNSLSLVLTAGGNIAFGNTVNIAGTLGAIAGQNVAAGTGVITQSAAVTATGGITFTGDDMTIGASLNGGGGIVQLQPFSSNQAIDLGTKPGGVLGLLQTDLNNITAGVLRIGNLNTSGNITVTAPITDIGTGWTTLSLLTDTSGGITQNAGATLTVTNLNVAGATGVTLNENNVVSTLSGASEGSFSFVDSTNLTIGSVDSGLGSGLGVGIITQAQPVSLTVNVLNDSLTVNQPIDTTHSFSASASQGAAITLTADNMALNNNSPSSVINAGTTGTVSLLPFTSTQNIAVGGPDAAGQLGVDDNDLANITASVVQIGNFIDTAGIAVSGTITRHAGYNTLLLTTGGSIAQTTPLSVANLGLQSNSGITLTNAANDVDTLAFSNTSGAVSYTDSNALAIGTVNGLTSSSNTGSTTTITAAGNLNLNTGLSSTGTLTLTSTGGFVSQSSGVITAPTLTGSSATGAFLGDANKVNTFGPFTNTTSGNIVFDNAQSLTAAGISSAAVPTGTTTLTVTNGGTLTVSGTGVKTDNGNIMLQADSMNIIGPINSGTARTVLTPVTAGLGIDLGTNPGGVLGLTNGGLSEITAGVLQIGSVGAGNIQVTGSITNPSGWSTLSLISNGAVSETGSGALTVPNLRVSSTGAVTLDSTSNSIQTVAAGSSSSVSITSGATVLTVGTVDGDAGIVTTASPITLTADGMSLGQQVNAGTARVTLQPLNSGTHIALGAASSAGTLGLTDASLGEITASVLEIGNASDNSITISGAVTRHAGYNTLALTTGSLISQSAPLSVANLALRTGQGINLTNPGNDVDTLAFLNQAGGVFYTDTNGLTIGPVDGLTSASNNGNNTNTQITTGAGGNLFLNADIIAFGPVILNSGGSVSEDGISIISAPSLNGSSATGAFLADNNLIGTFGPWSNTTSGNLSFTDAQPLTTSGTIGNSASTGTITLTETAGNSLTVGGPITSTNGTIALLADAMSLQAPVNSGTARTILGPVTFNQPIDLGTNPSAGKLGLADSDLNEVTAGVLQIGSIGAGDITVTAAIASPGTWNVLTLVTGGSVTETGAGELSVPDLAVSSSGAVTLNSTLNAIQVFAAGTTSSVSLTDAVPLTIGTVDGTPGITSQGAISLTGSFNNQLTVSQALNSTNSDISLTFDAMSLGAAVNAGTATVFVKPFNSANQTSLGVASTPGVLGITDAGLANITAGLLQIGDTGFADNFVEIGGPVTRHAGYSTLSLTAGLGISQTAPLSVANLALRSNGGITLTNTGNDVDTLAFNNTSGAVSFNNGPNPLTIGSVNGLTSSSNTGTTTTIIAGGNLNLNASVSSTGTLTLTSTGGSIDENGTGIITAPTLTGSSATGAVLTDANLVGTLDQFTNTTSGNLFFTNAQSLITAGNVANSAPSGSLTLTVSNGGSLTVGGNVSTVNGNLTLAADTMSINAAITSGTAATQLEPVTSGQAIDLGTKPSGVLGLTQGDLNEVSAGVLRIGDVAAGNITVTAPIATPFSANVLTLITSGSVSEQAGASLTVPDLRVAASGPMTLDQAGNAIQALAVDSTSSVTVVNSSNLTIGTVDGTVGVASTGAIALSSSAANTQLTVNQALDSGGAGDITLTFDQMSLAAAVNAGNGIVQLTPFSTGLAVDVGTKPGGVLGLSQTDLNNVTAGILRIGDLSTSGDLTVTAPITNPAGWDTLSLLTSVAGGISQNAGATLTVPNLNALGATGVSLTQSGNAVKTLAGGSLGSFSFVNSGNLTIGSVDPGLGGTGIVTGNGPISLASAGSNTTLTASQPIDTTFLGTAAGANITLTFDQMSLGAAVNGGTGGVVTLQPFSAIPIALGIASSPGALALTDASLGEVTGSVLQIGNANDGSITVGGAITRHAGYNTLSLTTGGSITQSAPLSVANLALSTGVGITLTNAGNDVDTLAFNNTGGAVSYTDSNALAIGSVNDLTSSSNTGTTTNVTAGGNLNLNANLSSTGNLTLTTTSGGLTLDNVTASGNTVTFNSAGAITQSGGSIMAKTLTGNSVGGATLNGPNSVGILGPFSNTGSGLLSFANAIQPFTTSGTVSSAGDLTLKTTLGGIITVGGNVSGNTVTLSSAASIMQSSGVITANTLTGSSRSLTSLTGANQISNLGAFAAGTNPVSAQDFTLFNTVPLTQVAGTTVSSAFGPILINNGGQPFTQSGTLRTGLNSSSTMITIENTGALSVGTISTGSGTVALGAAALPVGRVSETGTITAGTLTGVTSGGASLAGANNVGTLGSFSNTGAGGVSFTNAGALTVGGPVNAGTGDLALTTAALTLNGGLQAGGNLMATANGPIGVNGSLTFNAGKNLVLSSNGALTQTGTLTVASPDVVIDTTGRVGGAAQLLSDLLAAQGGGSSISNAGVINAAQFAPKGTAQNAISLATGTVDAPNSVLLLLGDGGAMTGTVNVLGLGVSGAGGSADLHGSIAGNSTQAAAQLGFIDPQPQNSYLFNGCAIGSATCTVSPTGPTQPPGQPVVGPAQPPPELLPSSLFSLVDALVARPSQDDFDVPLVGTLFDEPICRKLRRIDPEAARQVCQ